MKYLLTLLLTIASCGGCGTKSPDIAKLPTPEPEVRLSLSLIGADQMGHACAVDNVILTAGHVAAPVVYGRAQTNSYAWSDGKKGGWFLYHDRSLARDVGMFVVMQGDTPDYQYRQDTPATVGQHVSWYEYNYEPGKVLSVLRRESTIERLQAGHIVIEESPNPGASGSCLMNSRNEVIGIVTWGISGSGVAVDLTGQWWPFSEGE